MRKIGAVLMGVALVGLIAGSAWAAPGVTIGRKVVKWQTCSVACYDSAYKQLNGAPATNHTLDTTQVISTSDWMLSTTPSTVHAPARVWLVSTSGTVANTDSLIFAIDSSPDGVNWALGAMAGWAFQTAGDRATSAPITIDTDGVQGTSGGGLPAFIRLRFQSDAASNSSFPNAQVTITYIKSAGAD